MDNFADVISIIEKAGVIAFAVSGAMVSIDEELDLFGVLFLGLITALGGGVLRDTFLGNCPSGNFYDYPNIFLALGTAALVFLVAYKIRNYYFSHEAQIERINNAIDALGLGLFAVNGVQVCLKLGFGSNIYLTIFMGMLTGVGGGLMRDVICGRKPMIISKNIYAVAAILGSSFYYVCEKYRVTETLAVLLSVGLVFAIRMLATKFRWSLPKIKFGQR